MKKNSEPVKPGYKMTPLGVIPEDWEVIEFADFVNKNKAKFDPTKSSSNHFCIELEHINQETGQLLGYTNSHSQKSIKNVFYKGEVLFGKLRPYLRKYWFAKFDGVCSSEIWVLNGKSSICSNDYLFCLIQSNIFIQVTNVSSGSKMPRADWDFVSAFPFALPPLSEQKAIAEVLSTWDEAIEKTQELIEQKELRKKALMQQLLTGKKRLRGFSGEWKEVMLMDIVNIKKGEQLSIINMITGGKYYVMNGGIEPSGYTDNWNTEEDTITISEGGSCGFVKFHTSKFWSGGHCFVLSPFNSSINYLYLYQSLKSKEPEIMKLRVGSALPNIQLNSIKKFKIFIPLLAEQKAIAQILKKADEEIELEKQKLEQLKLQKKALMQVLLMGKKRIKTNN